MIRGKIEIEIRSVYEPYILWKTEITEFNVNNAEECIHDIVHKVLSRKNGTTEQPVETESASSTTSE